MNILWLFLILIISGALLFGAYKFMGKIGLYVFGLFSIIMAHSLYVANGGLINIGDYGFYSSVVMSVLFFASYFLLLSKYGTKTGFKFLLLISSALFAMIAIETILSQIHGSEFSLVDLVTTSVAFLVANIFEMVFAIIIYDMFRSTSMKPIWGTVISLAIIVLIDAIIFHAVFEIGSLAFADMMLALGTGAYQRLIVLALVVPFVWWIAHVRSAGLNEREKKNLEEENQEKELIKPAKVEASSKPERKEVKAKKVEPKKTPAKAPVKKDVVKEVKKPASKPSAKKAEVKKPASKKSVKSNAKK